ncbi:cupin domain-containing protein [Piscinibacter sp.]|jgi:quercetin dioxygenase-like cupin family protein|uniref:cupin domain-containing protein n=1 Tax=Piscinibacter sp. TaxID=1903157 RepID=UPI003559B7DF
MNTSRPDDERSALAADLLAAFAEAQAPEPLPETTASRIKQRVFERIAAAERGHVTVQPGSGDWSPFLPGVHIKVLHESGGIMSYLLRLQPGAVIPPHRHPIDEECVVMQGRLQIGDDLLLAAGGFHLAHKDTLHAPLSSVDGATIFLRGASPRAEHLV